MANLKYSNAGYYFDYKTSFEIKGLFTISTDSNFRVDYEVNSNDNGQPSSSSVTIYNLSDSHANAIEKGQYAIIRSGATDMFGIIAEGSITSIQNGNDGKNKTTVITLTEGIDYSQTGAIKNNQTTTKKTKNKTTTKTKKVNLSFKKGTKAKQILKTICSRSGIKLGYTNLATNKTYKKGYTLSQKPFQAIKSIANDCRSNTYYRKNKIVIDNPNNINPFKEQIYLSVGGGMTQQPSLNDQDDGGRLFTLECLEDSRISAGSAVYVESKSFDKLTRVQSCKHSKNGTEYTMELVVYG